jgi:AraC-like DNA-binding protein
MLAGDLSAAVQQMDVIAASIPPDLPMPERLATQQVVVHTIGRVMAASAIDNHQELARACVRWVTSYSATDAWSTELRRLIDTCAALIRQRGIQPAPGVRTRRALALVERRFRDPRLTLRTVAADCRLSVSHAARMIKRETGASFLAHVHRARVAAAAQLLKESTLSMKEIAAAVGYGSSSQLGRHFKRLRGTTPQAFRDDGMRQHIHTSKTREQ